MDLLDFAKTPPTAAATPAAHQVFPTLRQGRNWLSLNGWQPRHGGGYEKAGGYAEMKCDDGESVRIEIRQSSKGR
jgi:hypothetical protein